ncbi:MAG: hypothetical protein ABGY75_12045 [Gemmataceae bacterium]
MAEEDPARFFEVMPAGEMRAKYGLTAENRPYFTLDPANVPPAFRSLIPLAEQFGVSDDLIRHDIVNKTTPEELSAMREAVLPLDAAFDEWLAGPESYSRSPSAEYIAFTCLRLAAYGC